MSLQKCRLTWGLNRRKYRAEYKQAIQTLSDEKGRVLFKKIKIKSQYGFAQLGNWLTYLFCVILNVLQLIYLWFKELGLICPKPHPGSDKENFLIIGHRGAAAHDIENTLPAFEKAINDYGANALEIDICFTKDKHLVVWHDWDPDSFLSIARQAGLEPDVKYRPFTPQRGNYRRPVHELTLAELRENYGYAFKKKFPVKLDAQIPTLKEFMDWAQSKQSLKLVILDCKITEDEKNLLPNMMRQITQLINDYNPPYIMLVMTPKEEIMKEMIAENPNLDYTKDVVLPAVIVLNPDAFSAVKIAIDYKINHASAGRPTIEQLAPWTTYRRVIQHDVFLKNDHNNNGDSQVPIQGLLGWTINKRREMKCLLKLGIDGVVTDHPQRLKKILQKYKRPSN